MRRDIVMLLESHPDVFGRMHKVGKGEEKTCSSGGQGIAGQIPMRDPSLAPQGAVPHIEPDSAKH
ncbi:hypothetical protein H5410_045475 [Solanum commersonii]|uniref:Uncharacterized protein n=1 Tax=Solanum commersonii TaxID=4109 RepID=A0A9J5X9M3_SOLCO|nr:hypothetical protein H5410_045475 [Solanum commersonii]